MKSKAFKFSGIVFLIVLSVVALLPVSNVQAAFNSLSLQKSRELALTVSSDSSSPSSSSSSSSAPSSSSSSSSSSSGPTINPASNNGTGTGTGKGTGTGIGSGASTGLTPPDENFSNCKTLGLGTISCIVEMMVVGLTYILRSVIYFVFIIILLPILQTVLSIYPHTLAFASVILAGWVIIRNLMNIIFIAALIIIALATLFRYSKINYKHLLVTLVLNALLINFSLVIAQAILSIADTFQTQFLPNNPAALQALGYSLLRGPSIGEYNSIINDVGGSIAGALAAIIGVIFAVAALMVLAAIVAFLIIRLIALWVLLMTSPVAYAFNVLPRTQIYATKWWENFIRYAFFTPIMGLFLHLAVLYQYNAYNFINQMVGTNLMNNYTGGGTVSAAVASKLGPFVINVLVSLGLIGFLFATLELARMASIYGAAKVVGYAENKTRGVIKKTPFVGTDAINRRVDRAGVKVKEYKQSITSKLTQDPKTGEIRTGLGSKLGRYVLNSSEYSKQYEAETHARAQSFEQQKAGSISRVRNFSETGIDNKADLKAMNRIRDERTQELVGKTSEELAEEIKTILKERGSKNPAAADAIALRARALAQTGRLRQVIANDESFQERDEHGRVIAPGEYNDANVERYIKELADKNSYLESLIRNDMNSAGKKTQQLLLVGRNKTDATQRVKARAEYVNNLDDENKARVNVRGLDPETDAPTKEILQTIIKDLPVNQRRNLSQSTKDFVDYDRLNFSDSDTVHRTPHVEDDTIPSPS